MIWFDLFQEFGGSPALCAPSKRAAITDITA